MERTRVLVVGGGSRIASALAPRFGAAAVFVSRRASRRPTGLQVEDYGSIPDAAFEGVRCLVNCVGISEGSRDALTAVNVDTPCRIAAAAKAAGVPHMIHTSSFSVYGPARRIDRATPIAPASDYGRSKAAGDAGLLALADATFAVTILRLPLIYGVDSLGKLGQLLHLWHRTRVLPVPRADIARAMISVDLAASVVAQLVGERPRNGVVFAADPRPFTYADTLRARAGDLRLLRLPHAVTALLERALPQIGSRLFMNSELAEADNLAIHYGMASQLYRDIAAADLR
ncbi:NAD-dependent epimerase/dehydratase family protein [Sphingomonas psychrotolerans]|uniref:NAD-dependent epimerase/dehydratase family protein n=1 Tax=Sphingomonas psychrotolerans TaxID=1327635 RepID=A0ABU3N5A1_9SPHN|nr:NAD-dependent epimerase/dehydratase family protein [Sphingomonas psychrotolerans]MDT8759718.1 NAD-dependent epimerase/dehydratase family protein [Sphingomonas psychrotolerans]